MLTRLFSVTITALILPFSGLLGVAHANPPIEVPGDHVTIQGAVDAAGPGDKILIGPGVYNESLVVNVDNVWLIARDGLNTVYASRASSAFTSYKSFREPGIDRRNKTARLPSSLPVASLHM